MLRAHPEVRDLIGRNQFTSIILLTCVGSEFALAYALRHSPWWILALCAYCIGAFVSHLLFVLIHEATHNLIFKTRRANYLLAILANSAQVVPTAVYFMRHHVRHHAFQGVFEHDADLPSRYECEKFQGRWGKALWLGLFPIWMIFRTSRSGDVKFITPWILFNWAVVLGVDAAVFGFWGFKALAFITLSLLFSLGLHPLGGRWVQEHFLKDGDPQETYSYYGLLNRLQLNIGYHFEHHDLPSVPWNRLPKLKAIAPEFYADLRSHRSWTLLVLKFIFDPKMTVGSRMTRQDRGELDAGRLEPPNGEVGNQPAYATSG